MLRKTSAKSAVPLFEWKNNNNVRDKVTGHVNAEALEALLPQLEKQLLFSSCGEGKQTALTRNVTPLLKATEIKPEFY